MKQVMKVSGVIVILLGLLTLNRSWSSVNWSNNSQPTSETGTTVKTDNQAKERDLSNNYQTVGMKVTSQGYAPDAITVKKGIPVKWIVDAKEMTGCTSEILLPAFGIDRKLKRGENIIEFTPKTAGTYKFSCGMQMVWGKFIVTE